MTYEIIDRYKLQLGFCEGWMSDMGQLYFDRPFQPFLLYSKKGPVLCRGSWTQGKCLPAVFYDVRPIQRQPWMDLDIADVIVAMDLCVECSIKLPEKGFCRLTVL
jgi:hypothetical protein